MTEAERLQKVLGALDKENARLRQALQMARVVHIEVDAMTDKLHICITAVGIDDMAFIEGTREKLDAVASAIIGAKCTSGEARREGIDPDPEGESK